MEFSQIQHGSLVVQDLERAAAFYREILGLQEIAIPTTFVTAGLQVRWFQIGSQQIHLLQNSEPNQASPRHIALQVDDAQAARVDLRAKGLELDEDIPIPGADRFFITDPDSNRLEIIEWMQEYAAVPV
jgi:catechol 2,3-dioxygenase-like lactoylglutathione lyase family enzyme